MEAPGLELRGHGGRGGHRGADPRHQAAAHTRLQAQQQQVLRGGDDDLDDEMIDDDLDDKMSDNDLDDEMIDDDPDDHDTPCGWGMVFRML